MLVCVCVGASERRTERRGKRFRCFQGKVSGRERKTAMGRKGGRWRKESLRRDELKGFDGYQ